MHQYKINAKSAFTGDVWQWHQDYGTWKRDDGMPQPRAMNISVFLDEVMHINGPLLLVPRSQNAGDLKASHDLRPDHLLPAVDAGRGDRGRGWSAKAALSRRIRQGRRHADVPRQSGARLGRQHHALSAQDRLSHAERDFQLHPQPHKAEIYRPPRLHPRSRPWTTDALLRASARSHRQAADNSSTGGCFTSPHGARPARSVSSERVRAADPSVDCNPCQDFQRVRRLRATAAE